jgi:hypothetical protein
VRRVRYYYRLFLISGAVEQLPFDESHANELYDMGMGDFDLALGMNELGALRLVNKWNASHQARNFLYYV